MLRMPPYVAVNVLASRCNNGN